MHIRFKSANLHAVGAPLTCFKIPQIPLQPAPLNHTSGVYMLTRPKKVSSSPILRPQTSKDSSAHISTGRMKLVECFNHVVRELILTKPWRPSTAVYIKYVVPGTHGSFVHKPKFDDEAETANTYRSSIHSGAVVPPIDDTLVAPTPLPHAITVTTTSKVLAPGDSPQAESTFSCTFSRPGGRCGRGWARGGCSLLPSPRVRVMVAVASIVNALSASLLLLWVVVVAVAVKS